MLATREKLADEVLSRIDSRYLVCSLVAKRARQVARHQDSQGLAWAINQSFKELKEGKISYQMPLLEKPQARRTKVGKGSP